MATSQTAVPEPEQKMLRVTKSVFDLDSKEDVKLVKVAPAKPPVTNMEEFLSRLNNNATAVLAIINKGLEAHEQAELEKSADPWQVEEKDEAGNVTLTPFSGTPISEEKSDMLDKTVIQNAKMFFGYAKQMVAGDSEANIVAKRKAKADALAMILSNPAAIEMLKK